MICTQLLVLAKFQTKDIYSLRISILNLNEHFCMQIYKHKHLKQKIKSQNVWYNRTGIAICRGFLQRPNLFVLERDEFVWTLILDENPTRHKSLRYFFIMSYQTRMTQNTSESLYMQLRLFNLESSRSKTIFPIKNTLRSSFYLSKQSEHK